MDLRVGISEFSAVSPGVKGGGTEHAAGVTRHAPSPFLESAAGITLVSVRAIINFLIHKERVFGWFPESSPAFLFLILQNLFWVLVAWEEMGVEGNSPLLTIYLHELILSLKPHLHNTTFFSFFQIKI